MKRLVISLFLCVVLLGIVGCAAPDPMADMYTQDLLPGSNGNYSVGSNASPYYEGHFTNLYFNNSAMTGNFSDITVVDGNCIYIWDSDNSDYFSLCHDGGTGIAWNPTGSMYIRGKHNVVADLTGDSAGMWEFQVENSNNAEVASIDTAGNYDGKGYIANGNMSIRADGTIVPVSMADASALNNSIYFSTDSSKLSYKDSTGTVHDLY